MYTCGTGIGWSWREPLNPRLQRTVTFCLHGTYNDHIHTTPVVLENYKYYSFDLWDTMRLLTLPVTSVLPKRNWLRETRKQAQPTGCPLSHQSPRKLGTSYGVSQLIFKLREVSSHENWYIYIVRKSHDRWLCTQSQSRKGPCTKVWEICARWLCTVHDTTHCIPSPV